MYKSYKICGICDGPIFRGGIEIRKERGFGYSHTPITAHKGCFRGSIPASKAFIGSIMRMFKEYGGTMVVDLKKQTSII